MRNIIGTVIKINGCKAAIITRDCEILYIKKQPGMYLGLEIQFGANEIISIKNKVNVTLKIISPVAAIFICVFFISHFLVKNDNYTYICIDGKSSIELAVDSDMKVVKATSVNKKVQEDLMNIDLESKSLEVALYDVLNSTGSILKEGFTSDDFIIISVYTKRNNYDQSNTNENIERVLSACKDSADELSNNINFWFVKTNYEARRLAEKNNISVGRYYIYEIAQEQGNNISIEEAKNMQVGELVKKVNMPYSSIKNEVLSANASNTKITREPNPNNTATPTNNAVTTPSLKNTITPDNKNLPEATTPKNATSQKDRLNTVDPTPEVNGRDSADVVNDGKVKMTPTPITRKSSDKKVSSTPTSTPTPTPTATSIAPDSTDKKIPPTPVAPDSTDKKIPPTPVPPDSTDKKIPPTPAPTGTGSIKVSPTPAPTGTGGIKVSPTPAPTDSDDIKAPPVPVPPDPKETKAPPVPVPPDPKETKAPPVKKSVTSD